MSIDDGRSKAIFSAVGKGWWSCYHHIVVGSSSPSIVKENYVQSMAADTKKHNTIEDADLWAVGSVLSTMKSFNVRFLYLVNLQFAHANLNNNEDMSLISSTNML
jgi:hypothetical protein